jgi:radical SAM superfamily enzyme YgiQ (UPF0313 family)
MNDKKNVLLVLLPYWTPLMPPVGIASIKANLERKDEFNIITVDANIDSKFKNFLKRFYVLLKKVIPSDKWGNFYSISNNLLANLLIMYAYVDEEKSDKHIHEFISKTFFVQVDKVNDFKNLFDEIFQYLEEYITKLIDEKRIDYVGFSLFKGNLGPSLKCLDIVRKKYPHIKTIVGGGVFASDLSINSTNFNKFIEKNKVDKVIVGEGETLFNKVLAEIDSTKKIYTLDDLTETFNINKAACPDYDDYQLKSYPYLGVYGSRSCPCQCSFCSETLHWGAYRKKYPEKIVDEMVRLNTKYKKKLFLFCDSLLNPIIDDVSLLLKKKGEHLFFDGYLRADKNATVKEKAELWRNSGYYRARIGMESGSQRILNLMSKNITIQQMKDVLVNLADQGIKTTTYWLLGYPGETEEDFQDTLNFITEMKDYIYEAECNLFTYYESGQSLSDSYKNQGNISRLFDDEYNEISFISWKAEVIPNRGVLHDRMLRFSKWCQELGVPNPYSLVEILDADKRWGRLHERAVPSMLELI